MDTDVIYSVKGQESGKYFYPCLGCEMVVSVIGRQ